VIAFSAMIAEWLGRNAFSSAEAANVLGCPVVTFRGWLAGRSAPDYFTRCAIVRQMRDGHDPLSDVGRTGRPHPASLLGIRFTAEIAFTGPFGEFVFSVTEAFWLPPMITVCRSVPVGDDLRL